MAEPSVPLKTGWKWTWSHDSSLEPEALPYTLSGTEFKENHPLMWMIRDERPVFGSRH